MSDALANDERAKYEAVWEFDQYRKNSPAERNFAAIYDFLRREDARTVVEFGCGTGRTLAKLADEFAVWGIDIAENALDKRVADMADVGDIGFLQACLWDAEIGIRYQGVDRFEPITGDAGYCFDVMEHIPTQKVDAVFANIMRCVPRCFFGIAIHKDGMGKALIGQPLHLTVESPAWWKEQASKHGYVRGAGQDGRSVRLELHAQ